MCKIYLSQRSVTLFFVMFFTGSYFFTPVYVFAKKYSVHKTLANVQIISGIVKDAATGKLLLGANTIDVS